MNNNNHALAKHDSVPLLGSHRSPASCLVLRWFSERWCDADQQSRTEEADHAESHRGAKTTFPTTSCCIHLWLGAGTVFRDVNRVMLMNIIGDRDQRIYETYNTAPSTLLPRP